MQRNRSAFLLFELLLVFSLIGLLCAAGMMQLHFLKSGYVRSELNGLYQVCLYAQRHAITTGAPCIVMLDPVQRTYTCDNQIWKLAEGVRFGVIPNVKGPPSSPHTVITQATTFKNNCISCSPEGTIDAGTVYLTNDRGQCLYALTSGVAPYSFMRKYRYAEKWQRME